MLRPQVDVDVLLFTHCAPTGAIEAPYRLLVQELLYRAPDLGRLCKQEKLEEDPQEGMEGEGTTKEEGMEEEEVPIIQHTIQTMEYRATYDG